MKGALHGEDNQPPALDDRRPGNIKWWLCILPFCLLHVGLVLFNLTRVPPTHGYDWPGHLAYLQYVSNHWRTPPPEETPQFFNPPLYYFCAAALHKVTGLELGRAGQALNLLVALVTLGLLVAVNRRLWRNRLIPGVWFIAFYVLNPTVYRTFGMVRPEAMLLPIFAGAAWLAAAASPARPRWALLAAASGGLAGLAWGVRQWGVFLEIAFLIWLFVSCRRTAGWAVWRYLGLQVASFAALAGLFLALRGGSPLAFNASAHWPDPAFLTRLDVPVLFTRPVRPALDDSFWPVLYADLWGDYWRYWREALGRDSMPTSPAVAASLARAMWAALPATGLALVGLLLKASGLNGGERRGRAGLHSLARSLTFVSLAGFLAFAALYGEPGKGDTVKSIYLVYLVPFGGWLSSAAAHVLAHRLKWAGLLWLPLALLAAFVLPNGLYLPAAQLMDRTWQRPPVQCSLDEVFGEKIHLAGYTLEPSPAGGELTVTLVWTADAYVGVSYKVFVHLLDDGGQLLAQSDAAPARWRRTTTSWLPGEFISDTHTLSFQASGASAPRRLLVGLYDDEGRRLLTTAGEDHVTLEWGGGRGCGK